MNNSPYGKLDFNKLRFSEKTVTSKQALADVSRIPWSDQVMSGTKKVVISTLKTEKGK